MKILKFKMAVSHHIENVFSHNSAANCTISVKFCIGKQNSMEIVRSYNINYRFHKFKIMDGHHVEHCQIAISQ